MFSHYRCQVTQLLLAVVRSGLFHVEVLLEPAVLLCRGPSWVCPCSALCSPDRARAKHLPLAPEFLLPQELMVLPDILRLPPPLFFSWLFPCSQQLCPKSPALQILSRDSAAIRGHARSK